MSLVLRCIVWIAVAMAMPVLAEPPPVEHFTKWPAVDEIMVSPSGKRMAVTVHGPKGFLQVGVMDLDPIGSPRLVGSFDDADVGDVRWVSDERLVFSAYERGALVRDGGGGTFAVNHDGSESRLLIAFSNTTSRAGSNISTRVLPWQWSVQSATDDGSEDLFVSRPERDTRGEVRHVELARLNTRTGVLRKLGWGMPEGTRRWLLDAKREPRVVVASIDGRNRIHWRSGGEDTPWIEVANFDPLREPGFTPHLVDTDGRVIVSRQGDTGSALYSYDPVKRHIGSEPLVEVAGFDLSPGFQVDTRTRRVLGVHIRADRWVSVWFDPAMERVQRTVDAALPKGRVNWLHCGRCDTSSLFVVWSRSDKQPGEFYLYDRTRSSLQRISATRPWLDESTQGRRSFHRITARDGLSMPVVVTHPPQAKADEPLPAVVLVHGGPWSRGDGLEWSAEAQFLASRGYRVIAPEYRGSEGFGFKHFQAGWKQWGRAMQADLADAVQWAAGQKLIDPSRVCVYGGSYGGYASLMAPITHPGVFRCAVSHAGVTDIDLMYSINWSDLSEATRRYSMPVLIGDREKDAAQLAAASPLRRAAEIKVPVLVVHGAADRRVPLDHAKEFVAAAQKAGVDVESVYYSDEGHGWFHPSNHTDFLSRFERFLNKALAAQPR